MKRIKIDYNSFSPFCFFYSAATEHSFLYEKKTDSVSYYSKIVLGIWKLYIQIYLFKEKNIADYPYCEEPRYGFTFFDRTLHLHFGKTKVFDLPWAWEIVRHDLLYPWGDVYYSNTFSKLIPEKYKHICWHDIFDSHKYHYDDVRMELAEFVKLKHTTKDGRVQEAVIRLCGEEREWRWKWFKWLPFPRLKHRTVDCTSNIELGERAGQWKGGMIGWGCKWKEDQTMEQAFWEWYKDWNGR